MDAGYASGLVSRLNELRALQSAGRKITFVSGNFNVVHPGHLRLLKFASELGDVLVVGVNTDETAGVTLPMELRLENIRSISMITYPVALECSPERFIELLRPDFVVKGKEFEERQNPEQQAVDLYGGRLVFSSGESKIAFMQGSKDAVCSAIPR